jgi:hypothetical protein
MFNLFSRFLSVASLPDDESIVHHSKPIAEYDVGHFRVAIYRTKTRLLIVHAGITKAVIGWMPLGTRPEALKAAAQMNFEGFNLGWEAYEAFFGSSAKRQEDMA